MVKIAMPRIDALLTAMLSNRADAVSLADGDIAHLMIGGIPRPLTRQPLDEGQLVALLREMAPVQFADKLDGAGPLEFLYENEQGNFIARLRRDGGKLLATVSLAPAAANGHSAN